MVKGFFVTGTDTEVGKTIVAAALARNLGKRYRIGVFKPVQSGVESMDDSDAGLLWDAAGRQGALEDMVPYSFPEPVAPSVAAELAGVEVSIERVREMYENIAGGSDVVLVEGAGGYLVPIAGETLISDLAREFRLPVLIVARPDLGTINHTLLTISSVKGHGLQVAGVLINNWDEENADHAERSAKGLIEKFGGVPVLDHLPKMPGDNSREIIANLAKWMEENFDWAKVRKWIE